MQQKVSVLIYLLILQCFTIQCQTLTFSLQNIILQFIYTPEKPEKPSKFTFRTSLILRNLVDNFYNLSGNLINEKILIVNQIGCQKYRRGSSQCFSNFNSDFLFLDNYMLTDYHVMKINSKPFKQLLRNLTANQTSSRKFYNLTCDIIDVTLNHIEKPRDPLDKSPSNTSLIGIILLSVSMIFVFTFCVGWFAVVYYRQFKNYRNKRKRRKELEQTTQAILNKSPISIFDPDLLDFQSNDDEQPLCAICLEMFKKGDEIRKLICSHYFHSACIDPWVLSRQICPLCNQNILRHSIPSISSSLMSTIHNETTSIANYS